MRKNIFLSIIFLLSFFNVNAQYSIRGKVVSEDGVAVPNATVLIIKANLSKTTDSIGQFEFNGIPFPRRFNLLVSSVGFETTKFDATTDDHVLIILPKQTYSIDEVVVTSTRNPIKTNFTSQTIDSKKLNAQNTGVNLPYLLSSTPSLVATSDDGLGVGYTYFRVRGVDQTRINMTVNGVPLNDSESQDVFWVNMTDFASGLANVQVQRGVGTSTNGPAAFGASVNMLTALTADHPYAKIEFNAGSYNTFRESAKISTGLMPNGFAFDARISKVNSDGYLERAASDLYSYNFQGAYFNAGTMFKLLVFGGKEKTYMAWDGVDAETLAENPRYNPAGKYKDDNGKTVFYDNQTDNYEQQHFQLHFTQVFNNEWNINAALHYTHGDGFYEQYKTKKKYKKYGLSKSFINSSNDTIFANDFVGTDLVKVDDDGNLITDLISRKNLDNHFYGFVASANYAKNALALSFGGAVSNYVGDHFGNVLYVRNYPFPVSPNAEYYRNTGKKFDLNTYIKGTYSILKELSVFGDLQYRKVNYSISGKNDEDLKEIPVDEKFNFFNPKVGINYSKNEHSLYFNFAIANREPSRKNYTEAGRPHDFAKSERLYDYELGYNFTYKKFSVGTNLYFMDYDNQLVLTGQYSETGAYLTKNVKDSYRTGVEFVADVQPFKWLQWHGNLTLSKNKILHYSDWVDDWYADWNDAQVIENEGQVEVNYGNTDISFSPNITAGSVFSLLIKQLSVDFQTVYVGKQYLDNTQNEAASLNNYCVNNLLFTYSFFNQQTSVKRQKTAIVKDARLKLQINNIFNKTKYATNGGAYGYFEGADANGKFLPENQKYTPWFYAQAGINFHIGVAIDF